MYEVAVIKLHISDKIGFRNDENKISASELKRKNN